MLTHPSLPLPPPLLHPFLFLLPFSPSNPTCIHSFLSLTRLSTKVYQDALFLASTTYLIKSFSPMAEFSIAIRKGLKLFHPYMDLTDIMLNTKNNTRSVLASQKIHLSWYMILSPSRRELATETVRELGLTDDIIFHNASDGAVDAKEVTMFAFSPS